MMEVYIRDSDDILFVKWIAETRQLFRPFENIAKFILARASYTPADNGEVVRVISLGHDAILQEKDLIDILKSHYYREWHSFQSAKEKAEWAEDIRKNG
jgi:hypothetical protein